MFSPIYSNLLEISNMGFHDCEFGVLLYGNSIEADNCSFIDCNYGISIEGPNDDCQITNSTFLRNGVGFDCYPFSSHNVLLYCESNVFKTNYIGIRISSNEAVNLVLECNNFFDNIQVGAKLGYSTIASLSPTYSYSNKSGGNNTFSKNNIGIEGGGQNCHLYLEDGENNFIGGSSTPYNFVTGVFSGACGCIVNGNLNAIGNYWEPTPPTNDIISGGSTYYSISVFFHGGHSIPSDLEGAILTTVNELCYDHNPDPGGGEGPGPGSGAYNGTTGLDETNAMASVSIYPNPVDQDWLFVELNFPVRFTWKLTDMSGKTNLSGESSETMNRINMSGLAEGIYYFHCNSEHENVVKKIVLVR